MDQEGRQFTVMDAKGKYVAFTVAKATPWAGSQGGKYCTAQGNILAGEGVVNGMVEAFENTTEHLRFGFRLPWAQVNGRVVINGACSRQRC